MNEGAVNDRWIARFEPKRHPQLRLFCLPYAGGGTAAFRGWPQHLPAHIEVCAVQLPGRERRIAEAPMTDAVAIASLLAQAMAPYCHVPFALFGHSMGAGIAYETALALVKLGGRAPLCLFASARRAPQVPARKRPLHNLPNDAFIDELRHLNGTPADVLENQELMELMLPVLRSDFRLAETYRATTATALPCPVVAFGGADDPGVDAADLDAWRERGTDFRLHVLPGDHFFIHTSRRRLLELVAAELERAAL